MCMKQFTYVHLIKLGTFSMAIWKVLTLFSLLTLTTQVQGQAPVSPFFLLCNYHGNGQEVGASTGEVKLSVSIHGNPDNYVPGQYYKVTITSSLNFDGFFLTGLYTISSPALQRMQALGMQGGQPVSQNLMCSIVHSHMSQSPVRETTFMWIAPPAGSGCVNFLATAMLGQQMLFKDTTVLHLCEEGAPTLSPLRPVLAELHSDSMIFRDDFDSFKSFGQDHWSSHEGVDIGTGCGSLFYGDAAVFCENTGNRRLVTAALNTTTAAVLQFFLGTGSCRGSDKDADIMVLFGLNGCQDWFILDSLPPPTNGSIPKSVLIHLPEKARGDGVCFAWSQEPTLPQKATIRYTTEATTHSRNAVLKDIATTSQTKFSLSGKVKTVPTTSFKYPPTQPSTRKTKSTPKTTTDYKQYEYTTEIVDYDEQNITFPEYTVHEVPAQDNPLADAQSSKTAGKQVDFDTVVGAVPGTFQGCWAIDHVIIVNTAHVPTSLQDTFNPINPSDWLSFPGAHFKQHCHSDDTAMVFNHKSPVTGVGSRDLDLSVPDYQKDIILAEQFEDKALPGWQVSGGNVDLTCGIIHSGSSVVFDGPGKSRRICTPDIDPRKAGNLRFHFGLGSGGCHSDDIEKAEVIIYMEDTNEHTIYIIEKLDVNSYKEPKLVSVPLKPIERHSSARICWVQKFSGGQGQNVWALDNVEILPYLPQSANTSKNKMAQFSLNLNCGNFADNNDVELKYSTNYGSTWHRLHEPCLPAQCDAEYRPLDTHFHADTYKRWRRFTTPLPYAAMVPVVRFRWEKTSSDDPNWALDNVYIGTCKEGCNGHGACLDGKCSCDFGYIGDTCESTIAPNPTILLENFDGTGLPISTGIEHILGASLSFDCDVLSTGKAAVFNLDGRREFLTAELNTTNTMYIQFNIRVGSNSPVSGCPAAEKTKELVLLDYTCNGGVTWQLLKSFNTVDYRSPMSDSVLLPNEARNTGCKFRWWQPEHSGYHQDVWALDDISINDHLFNTLHVHMNNMVDIGEQLAITNGRLSDTYCRKMKSISFIGSPTTDNVRLLTTESMHIGPGYIMQFELVMGCGLPYSSLRDNRLYLEYSTDHGIHWSLVVDPCLPPSPCDLVHQGTIYDWTQYREWTRVTVPLPTTTWGPSTRFRLRQDTWARTDTWGVARLYIGQQCPNMCHGHGECNEGVCRCDEGFEGVDCHPATHLNDKMQADFGIRYEPDTDFEHIRGGKVVHSNQGCGNIHSDESLYFFDNGVRELVSKDMDTRRADYLQFYLRIGGDGKDCFGSDLRSNGVIVQYSTNGGITWKLLDELVGSMYRKPRVVNNDLPAEAQTPSTRFRWWQPQHSGKGYDQWALDEISLGQYENLRTIEDDFDKSVEPLDSGMWLTAAGGVIGKYCNSQNPVLILANQDSDKRVVTKDLKLQVGDVIQFKINVGCSNQFRWDHPVLLQYWPRGGNGFQPVRQACYPEMACNGHYTEASMYYAGPHGHWELVVIHVTEELAKYPIILRWWQPGGYPYNFALDDVYIGPPCTDNCNRNGPCRQGACSCDSNYEDPFCQSDDPTPYGIVDRFEQLHRPSDLWRRILGGQLGAGCGLVDNGKALFFDGDGAREAVTVPLNTTYLRIIEFVLQIGSTESNYRCTQPSSPNEAVIVDYSTDNEITWYTLKVIEPPLYTGSKEHIVVELPPGAKSDRTIFRWWQPLGYGGMKKAEFGLDSVSIGVNETNLAGFQDDFAGMMPDMFTWYQTESAVPRITCNSKGNALEFSRNGGKRYAETWDYHVTPSTFLQFDIAMGCDSLYGTLYGVMLEYSTNMGRDWQTVTSECAPPSYECDGYHLKSDYMSDQHQNWTRISVNLPQGAVSPATRFRWQQHSQTPSGNVWALDNVYLGDGCPWLCSGHGYCNKGTCVCDDGYAGEYCVASRPLPMMLRDDFNRDKPKTDNWLEVYGAETSNICGTLISGNALTFTGDQLRMAVTRDLDTTMLTSVEFYFLFGCNGSKMEWPRKDSVLLQFSTNGGITWKLLKELHYRNDTIARFFSIELPMDARYNSTRLRFWQPHSPGKMLSTWAVDNLFIGRMMMNPSSMSDNFESGTSDTSWLFVNDGELDSYCEQNTRSDSMGAGQTALVFRQGHDMGEHSVITRDLNVGPMSVLQFDINVGCSSESTHKYPVHLEYSSDGGKTWSLVVPNCAQVSSVSCHDSIMHPSIYYGGTTKYWRRVSIPLDNLYVCGTLRFRWYQGFIPDEDFGPEWAIDNVFIGMACMQQCLGHGDCNGSMICSCDAGYHGDACQSNQSLPVYMKEGFRLADGLDDLPEILHVLDSFSSSNKLLDERKWAVWSGGLVAKVCGLLLDGHSLVFQNTGERVLVTRELDLSKATTVQFYLRLGCDSTPPDPATPPVYAQYSVNGGINWHTIEQFDFNTHSNRPSYIVLNLPESSRSKATQFRWWQPSKNGTYMEDWAIDEIYIGGDHEGEDMLADDPESPRDPIWTLTPGAVIEPVCGSTFDALHFTGEEKHRFAVTADVVVMEGSFLQVNIALGCTASKTCFNVSLLYSHDHGVTWQPVLGSCLLSHMDCETHMFPRDGVFLSDVNTGWTRNNIPLPFKTRSKFTRFLFVQPDGFNPKDTWALANLYIGNHCPQFCNGHGRCTEFGCLCDEDWSGYECSVPLVQLPGYVYDMFEVPSKDWEYVVGAKQTKPCKTMASGLALHFAGNCTRGMKSRALDLSTAEIVQFNFLYGCGASPDDIDESVLIGYSTNGVDWNTFGTLHYLNYRSPSYVTMKLPDEARTNGTSIGFYQFKHSGANEDDWLIDDLRIGGQIVNPDVMMSDFSGGIDPAEWNTLDNMQSGKYCERKNVSLGTIADSESATMTTQDLDISEGHMLQFWYNIGCMRSWNTSVAPMHLQYSTDRGMSWAYVTPQCLSNDPTCPGGASMASVYYGDPMGTWQRVTISLKGMPVSRATRFRWQQRPVYNTEAVTNFGLTDVYIGPACHDLCGGHGNCLQEGQLTCTCDPGHHGDNCYPWNAKHQSELKDIFDTASIDKSKWELIQGGAAQNACIPLVEKTALVQNGPGLRQVVTRDLDLRDAKFVQYMASIGGAGNGTGCFKPFSHDQSVVLQFSTDGGIHWHTLHILDYTGYSDPRHDYIRIPQAARTPSTRVRWWQPLSQDSSREQPSWALDNLYIGGHEINPAQVQIHFNESVILNDQPWEFNVQGHIAEEMCKKEGSAIVWEEGTGQRHFTTKQAIVQHNYILQFKIVVGCNKAFNVCDSHPPVRLMFNKNPLVDTWHEVVPTCLPDVNLRMDCSPNMYHVASEYTVDKNPVWSRVTVGLPEKTFSSTTRFRWLQDTGNQSAPGWALDDIYIGESCPVMCHGRGDCKGGTCHCDEGYTGVSCMPLKKQPSRIFDSFEDGIYATRWEWVSGGGIGFGCGALLPYAHGKTLYFNGCGQREARTVEMDLTRLSKIMFVLQIGCRAQTPECNVKMEDASQYRGVLLQYSTNKGSEWRLLARHDPADHLTPKRMAYDLPYQAQLEGVQFRWWQPVHGGEGKDQWALDHVEVVPSRVNMKFYRRRRGLGYM